MKNQHRVKRWKNSGTKAKLNGIRSENCLDPLVITIVYISSQMFWRCFYYGVGGMNGEIYIKIIDEVVLTSTEEQILVKIYPIFHKDNPPCQVRKWFFLLVYSKQWRAVTFDDRAAIYFYDTSLGFDIF